MKVPLTTPGNLKGEFQMTKTPASGTVAIALRGLQLYHQGLEKLLDYLASLRAPLPHCSQHPERSEEKVSAIVRA